MALYVAFVGVIWGLEGEPPALGETAELAEAKARTAGSEAVGRRVGHDLAVILAGVAAMAAGATVLVEGVRHLAHADASQARLSLTLVGFATAFELVALSWSTSRRGTSEAVVAAVVGSFAYNATMTLGAAALLRPLAISHASRLHTPLIVMLGALAGAIALAWRTKQLTRSKGIVLLLCYPLFVAAVLAGV
jgi:cation:H+ antiporter